MQHNNLLLFVYGTLRRSCPSGAHSQYLHGAKLLSPAKIRGLLFLIDYYPGLCINKKANEICTSDWVKGEVYSLTNIAQLQQLDSYEGCASDSPYPHEYSRTLVDVTLPTGQLLKVWTYLYNGETSSLPFIASGDFLQP